MAHFFVNFVYFRVSVLDINTKMTKKYE